VVSIFPYHLVRLPCVPRSLLHALVYQRSMDLVDRGCVDARQWNEAFQADAAVADPAAVALLQWPPFLAALEAANPELAVRVAALPRVAELAMRKKERQTVRAALRYLWRAALRPVPFGLLCSTALGVLSDEAVVPPDLRTRRVSSPAVAPRLGDLSPHLAALRRCRLYLDPLCRIERVRDRFQRLVFALAEQRSRAWLDLLADGFDEQDLRDATMEHVAGICAGAPGEDEAAACKRVLWEAVPHDITLLDRIVSADADPPARSDSCHTPPLALPDRGINAFLEEIAAFGSRVAEAVGPFHRAMSRLVRGSIVPLLDLFEQRACAATEISDDDLATAIAGDLLSSLGAGERIVVSMPHQWAGAPLSAERLCCRFRRATDGPNGPRYHLVYFGGSRMSLLPRYAALPYNVDFAAVVREWMDSWPDVRELYGVVVHDADVHPPFTRSVIHCGGPPPPASTRLADLRVVMPRDREGLEIIDPDGRPVQPVFFGVAAEYALPPPLRFALALGHPHVTVLEAICRALGIVLARQLALLGNAIAAIPEITLGRSIVLCPNLFLVPAAALPAFETPVTRREFFHFHDWLRRSGLPAALAQCSGPGEEPQWVDFRLPEGVNNFIRLMRSRATLFVTASFLAGDEQGLEAIEGWYEPEYYAEVAAGKCNLTIHGSRSLCFTHSG
jgi:hypothetical protein